MKLVILLHLVPKLGLTGSVTTLSHKPSWRAQGKHEFCSPLIYPHTVSTHLSHLGFPEYSYKTQCKNDKLKTEVTPVNEE